MDKLREVSTPPSTDNLIAFLDGESKLMASSNTYIKDVHDNLTIEVTYRSRDINRNWDDYIKDIRLVQSIDVMHDLLEKALRPTTIELNNDIREVLNFIKNGNED